jgi:hypothetical protein
MPSNDRSAYNIQTQTDGRDYEYAAERSSDARFMHSKVDRGGLTDTQHSNLIIILLCFRNKENSLKKILCELYARKFVKSLKWEMISYEALMPTANPTPHIEGLFHKHVDCLLNSTNIFLA